MTVCCHSSVFLIRPTLGVDLKISNIWFAHPNSGMAKGTSQDEATLKSEKI